MKVKILFLLAITAIVGADDSEALGTAINFVKDCKGDYFLCVKEKILRIVDNLRSSRSLTIAEGVVVKGDVETRVPKKLEDLPLDPISRDEEVNFRLLDGVLNLFETHTVEIKMNAADKQTLQRSLEEGRGKKKGGGAIAGIIGLLAAKMLFGKLLIVKLIALKALATAKIAFVLAVILFVAWCLKQDHTKTTYEVVPHALHHESHHPVHVEHDSGHGEGYSSYGSDWNKNLDEAQNLAYSGYANSQ